MESARITVLMDNTARMPDLATEHGLAMALEIPDPVSGRHMLWLWDTGQSAAFLNNAAELGIDPSQAHGLALSHGHYDHTGGLAALMAAGFKGPLYAHPGWTTPRFAIHPGSAPRAIGLEAAAPPLPMPEVIVVENAMELAPGMCMLTHIPRLPGNPENTKDFYFDVQGNEPDPVQDDACLALETAKGLVLVLGCCHSGLENTLACVAERMGISKLHAVVGGLHLMNSDREQIERSTRTLTDSGVERAFPGHCTGSAAFRQLRDALGSMIEPLGSGLVLEF